MAPLAFQHDPDETYHALAVQLRNGETSIDFDDEDSSPLLEPIEEEKMDADDLEEHNTPVPKSAETLPRSSVKPGGFKSSRSAFPETPDGEAAPKFQGKKSLISESGLANLNTWQKKAVAMSSSSMLN